MLCESCPTPPGRPRRKQCSNNQGNLTHQPPGQKYRPQKLINRLYKTYTTGQLRIKTVFQNNIQFQDSSHVFLFIFSRVSSRVQSSIRGG